MSRQKVDSIMVTASRMSPAALANCRAMRITTLEDGTSTLFEITDPKLGGKVVVSQTVRTLHDAQRYTLAWSKRYRIPGENITRVNLLTDPVETPNTTENASVSRTSKGTFDVHGDRNEVLGSGVSRPDPSAAEGDKPVSE